MIPTFPALLAVACPPNNASTAQYGCVPTPTPPDLPYTGDPYVIIFLIVGLLLLTAGLWLAIKYSKNS